MRGYKGMDKNMRCRGMQYLVGETYKVDGYIRLCVRGLHFCEKLSDVFSYYKHGVGNRFFEIEANGTIKTNGTKSVASELTVIRELSEVEINRIVYGCGNGAGNDNGDIGCGRGNGYSCGYCYSGNGYGYSNGNGYGCGWNYNDGWGNGYGCGWNYGNGNGYGYNNNIQNILMFD